MIFQKTLPLEPGSACINSCSFNHNGQLLITGGADGMIRLFGKLEFSLTNAAKAIFYITSKLCQEKNS
jgi:WD40 repeat protein